jgi:hypothetical protein
MVVARTARDDRNEGVMMADIQNAKCTCPEHWYGYLLRPICILHHR